MNPFSIRTYKSEENYLEEKDMTNWISRVQLLIYLVSLLDSIIIGIALWFILKTLGASPFASILVGLFTFLLVFPAIIVIDVSISTFDTSNYYGSTSQKIADTDNKYWRWISNQLRRIWSTISFTIFIRTILYFIVFIVSFISLRFIFDELLQDVNRFALSELKVDRENNFSNEILQLNDELLKVEEQMYKEAAGTGDSKIRGIGPAYNTLKKRKRGIEQELVDLKNTKTTNVNIDSLARLPYSELVIKYPNYKFVNPPVIDLPILKNVFGDDPLYFHELIAAILSFILFLSIIILKVTGGERINKIYYNSALQDLYRDYLTDNIHEKHKWEIEDFSNNLKSNYQPSAEAFYRWFNHQYHRTERELILDTLLRIQNDKIIYLDNLIEDANRQKELKFEKYNAFVQSYNSNSQEFEKYNLQLSQKNQVMEELRNGIDSIDSAIKAPVDSEYIINLTNSQIFQKKEFQNANNDINNLKGAKLKALNQNFTIEDKVEITRNLKEMDEQLYQALISIKNKLIMVFVKQKLTITDNPDGIDTYTNLMDSIFEFIDNIIGEFNQ